MAVLLWPLVLSVDAELPEKELLAEPASKRSDPEVDPVSPAKPEFSSLPKLVWSLPVFWFVLSRSFCSINTSLDSC
jgi:hypothetical protein